MSSVRWQQELGSLRFRIGDRVLEHRLDRGSGPSLSVEDTGVEARALLRFDCFEGDPHLHLDPDGSNRILHAPADLDPIDWCMAELRTRLPDLLAVPESLPEALLAGAERAMRNPPAQLSGLDLAVLRTRKSEKWHTYPPDVLPAWVAEMDFPLAEPIRLVLQRALEHWDIGYPIAPHETGLREAFAARMDERFGWRVDPRRVEVLSEVVQGLYLALESYANPGEGAVVQTPIYPPFLSALAETGRRLVENRLLAGAEGYAIDFDALRADIDRGTRLLLLCNPHNPTGRVFTRYELEALAEIALAHDLVVVSDEIHCDLVYEGRNHIPFATLSPELAERTVTLNSASKAFNIPGLRCAIAHFGSAELQHRFAASVPRHVRGGIGILGPYASIAAWQHAQPWLDCVLAQLEDNRRRIGTFLAERLPDVGYHTPQGTYLAWLDCSRLPISGSPAKYLLERGHVALSDGRYFGGGWDRHVRLNFATSSEILEQVLERVADALAAAE